MSESSYLDEVNGSRDAILIPHILEIQEGEDITGKILTFCPNARRAVCVLSATGIISNAALSQAATPERITYYEGQFNILSLSGSFVKFKVHGQTSRTGGLSVALLDTDGKIFGGRVNGALIAATPGQVMLGSFVPDDEHNGSKSKAYEEPIIRSWSFEVPNIGAEQIPETN